MKVTKETFFKVEYAELERVVHETWPAWKPGVKGKHDRGWSFCADEEVGNDTNHRYSVTKSLADDIDQADLADFAARLSEQPHYRTGLLLDELCRQGVIEPGDYLVEVYW